MASPDRAVLDALSSSGHLVPEGSKVREELGARFDDSVVEAKDEDHLALLVESLDAYAAGRDYPSRAQRVRRHVITTPWTPSEPEEKS